MQPSSRCACWPHTDRACAFSPHALVGGPVLEKAKWLEKLPLAPQVKNSSGEDTREGVYVTSAEEHELAGSKGTANFVIKWVRDARTQANLKRR